MTRISRRGLLRNGAAAGVLAATGLPVRAQEARRGGRLVLGLSGANTSDSWDARRHADVFMVSAAQGAVFDCLTEVAADGSLVGELATDWEASSDAKTWTFNLRRGVRFHNGKAFGADDVIESIRMHSAKGAKSGATPLVEPITEIRKLGAHQVQFVLNAGNADFPYLMSDYHLLIYPAGQIEEAIANGIGTGLYRVQSFDPGVRFVGTRVDGHYKDGQAGWVDEVEYIAINDTAARMNALLTGRVDGINRVDFKSEKLLRANPNLRVQEVTGNQHYTFPMLTNVAPFDDVNVRRALKHGINREEMVAKILSGHGRVARDSPIGPANQYMAELDPIPYDPDRAKYYLRLAGMDSLDVTLSAASAAFEGAVDAAQLYRENASAGGININVVQEPADGYWSDVWLRKPWCASYWSGRATEDWMFSSAYQQGVAWNDSRWGGGHGERFQTMLVEARATLDTVRRREMYTEMQQILRDDSGVVIPMFANWVDALSNDVGTPEQIGNLWQMDNSRQAERWWKV
ncbi:ABC transporter substrate-binding protein [Roseivivax sediminis]|uniref:Peptide/nickel transport system substrate-binding protein n=1 Tax=Roseivivax sediminis TaxID=936889 RepID=A0A1I2A2D0_9RHOB|nr:ABC transporter substrate-binding protein [Roseivivax sediminis]SFE38274.1 peptide/nickel transport system substrate-binding protein [Roseivivax sediminis]